MVSPSDPLVAYEPATWLQSAVPWNVSSSSNVIVYLAWSAAGTTPWKAGAVSV